MFVHACLVHLFGMPVPPVISKLMDAVSDHHWCIPFSVSGNPEPKLSWLLEDKPVEEGSFIHTMIHDYSEGEYHGCLQLDSPTHINNGKYTLLASNAYGEDSKAVFAHFMHEPWNGELKLACSQIKTISVNVTQNLPFFLFHVYSSESVTDPQYYGESCLRT